LMCMLSLSPGGERSLDWLHLRESFRRHVSPNSTVVEIGASNQARSDELAAMCREYIGIEYFSERLLPSAGNKSFRNGDWQKLTDVVPANSVDLVIASHVIEHVPDDLRALEETYNVLKPGGIALINTPNRRRLPRAIIETWTGPRKFPWWEHVREYVEADLADLIRRSPFHDYAIYPVALGLHASVVACLASVPKAMRGYANFWEIHLKRDSG